MSRSVNISAFTVPVAVDEDVVEDVVEVVESVLLLAVELPVEEELLVVLEAVDTTVLAAVPLFAAPTPLQAVTLSKSPPVKAIIIIFFFIILVSFLISCLLLFFLLIKVLLHPFQDGLSEFPSYRFYI